MPRKPLPAGEAREVILRTRVKPRAVAAIDALRGEMTHSEVLREALNEWISRRKR